MGWYKRKSGGFAAVNADIGKELYTKTVIHDDGMIGLGGNRTVSIGDLGSGKTTLALETALKFCYLPNCKKEDFLRGEKEGELYPETVIWRGRKRDYWNLFEQNNFMKSFPNQLWKPLRVLHSEEDDLSFYEDREGRPVKLETMDVQTYTDIPDLYNKILKGGINVIYPPKMYYLSPLLKKTLNEILMLHEEDKKFYDDDEQVHVPNFVFWYDLFYFLIEIDKNFDKIVNQYGQLKWITFIFDEAHQIFPVAKAPLWHLVDHFAEHEMIDTRRVNISMWIQVHEMAYVYWKVLNRFNMYIWLPRSKENKRLSVIRQELINKIPIGFGVIEEKGGRFGSINFPRIKDQPPILSVKGYD